LLVANILVSYNTATNLAVKSVIVPAPAASTIKLITAVIYSFRNKLECLSLNTRLGRKGLPGTNALAYYGITTVISFMVQTSE